MDEYDLLPGPGLPGTVNKSEGAARERMRRKILFMAVILFSALFSVLIFLDILYWVFN
jgi:hypothetical protein